MKRTIALLILASAVCAQGVEAQKGTLRVTVSFDGKFAPADPAKLKLDTKQYKGPFEVEMITENGSWVNEGDIIARIKRKGYDEQLKSRTMGMERAEMDHRHYLASAKQKAQKTARSLARAERDNKRSQKKLKGFREFEKSFREERERQSKQSREYGMENQKDELTQLEKMYAEDELVDATEEIVLKRARRRYAQSLARTELSEQQRKYNKEWYEHWTEENFVYDAESKAASLASARASAEMAEEKAKLDLAKRAYDLERARESFEKFKADGEKLTLRAPYAGLLLHSGGKWEKGAQFRQNQTVATVMKANAMSLGGSIKEADIMRVQSGLAVSVAPAAMKDKALLGRLKVDYLPSGKGAFKATVEFDTLPTGLRPGMSGKAEIVIEEVRDAVLIPKSAVKDGKVKVFNGEASEWRDVVTGPTDGKQIVIRDGVSAGEKVDPAPK
ncbi:MAG: efflux RND transporter periplasmic adaptor subunit [Planctomycetota bacterium]